jgi:hypothetical protein
MNRPSIAQFISDKRAEGKSDSQISHLLLDAGWHMDVIHKALNAELTRTRELTPVLKPKNPKLKRNLIIASCATGFILLCLIVAFI